MFALTSKQRVDVRLDLDVDLMSRLDLDGAMWMDEVHLDCSNEHRSKSKRSGVENLNEDRLKNSSSKSFQPNPFSHLQILIFYLKCS